ncbi:Hypothetical predicted protein [Olea europaea subsp. europaea]|uniref:Secreted protein n=1 Tax=Olea europaea subsp. europaea TaxID=158383 RepID=A0A8S0Q179_OLEEU|nr:Hypothetical predicted protein [Olea europaea subsp. europaea]
MAVRFWYLTSFCLLTLKANLKVEETAPGVATGMILSLRERQNISRLSLRFKNGVHLFRMSTSYPQNLRSSEESFREQLEKAKKKEAAFIVTFAK